ncbi:MAG: PAS domain S-box protein, partial [Flavisolibacter sp.]
KSKGEIKEGGNSTNEFPSQTKENMVIHIEVRVAPTQMNDENFYIIFITDISERKKTEEVLKNKTIQSRTIIQNSSTSAICATSNRTGIR